MESNHDKASVAEKEDVFLSVVIPAFKEPGLIEVCVGEVCKVLDAKIPERYEVIVVENDDNLLEITNTLKPTYSKLRTIKHESGTDNAVSIGWKEANGNVLGIVDGDFTDTPTTLSKLIDSIEEGADMVIGSQYLGRSVKNEPTVGCFIIRKKCIEALNKSSSGYKVLLEILGPDNICEIMSYKDDTSKPIKKWQTFFSHMQGLLRSQS